MADKDVIRKGSTSIEVYRSNDAAPESWEDAKFWLTNELRRIQAGFFSADEVISILDAKIGASVSGGTQGTQGVPGKDGAPGRDGRDGVDGKDGKDADPVDLIYDGSVRTSKAWSSLKTRREIDNIPVAAVKQHESALSITESQISDFGTYLTDITGQNIGDLANVNGTITPTDKQPLVFDEASSLWVPGEESGTATALFGEVDLVASVAPAGSIIPEMLSATNGDWTVSSSTSSNIRGLFNTSPSVSEWFSSSVDAIADREWVQFSNSSTPFVLQTFRLVEGEFSTSGNASQVQVYGTNDGGSNLTLIETVDGVLDVTSDATYDFTMTDTSTAYNGYRIYVTAFHDGGDVAWRQSYLSVNAGVATDTSLGEIEIAGDTTDSQVLIKVYSGGVLTTHIEINEDGVKMPNLPTADPVVAGQLWNDSGTLKVSAG